MDGKQYKKLQNCIRIGITAAMSKMSTADVNQMVLGPYLELENEYVRRAVASK